MTAKEICYVHPSKHPVLAKARSRFEKLSGFSFLGGLLEHENFQLVNYGVGGALRAHHDVSPFPFVSRLVHNYTTLLWCLNCEILMINTEIIRLGK